MSNIKGKRQILVQEFSKIMESWGNIFRKEANESLQENHHNNREYNDLIDISDRCKQLSQQAREKI